MSEISRLDYLSDRILRLIVKKPSSILNLSYITDIFTGEFGAPIRLLLDKGYIKPTAPYVNTNEIKLDTVYTVTLEGRAYIENIDRLTHKENIQRRFNYYSSIIATIALIKSFLPELIALWKLLVQ